MPLRRLTPAAATGLPQDSVVNVTALVTLDKADLGAPAGQLPDSLMDDVARGLRWLLFRNYPGSRHGSASGPGPAISV
jgi:mRNA interferase MazF